MIVVARDRTGGDVDREDGGYFQQSLLNPCTAVLETTAASAVFAAQKCAAHAMGTGLASRHTSVFPGPGMKLSEASMFIREQSQWADVNPVYGYP